MEYMFMFLSKQNILENLKNLIYPMRIKILKSNILSAYIFATYVNNISYMV